MQRGNYTEQASAGAAQDMIGVQGARAASFPHQSWRQLCPVEVKNGLAACPFGTDPALIVLGSFPKKDFVT